MTVIKVFYQSTIRRFNLPEESDQLFALLAKALTESFGVSLEEIRVTYVDDEGDQCVVSGNEELREAIRFFKASPVKLSVEQLLKSIQAPQPPSPAPAPEESVQEPEVVSQQPPVSAEVEPVVVVQLESKEDVVPAEPMAPSAFVRDVTLPDGSIQACGASVLKIWEITNNGATAWPENCKLVLCKEKAKESKPRIRFNKDNSVVLPALAAGASCEVGIELQLPHKHREGAHQIFFELVTGNNERFAGDYLLFADLVVQAPLPSLTKHQFLRSVPVFLTPPELQGAVDEEVRAVLTSHLEQHPGIAVHTNIRCDGCDQFPIQGARFQCTVCHDFDLCESCEAKGTHPVDHPLVKLNRPRNHRNHPHHRHHPHHFNHFQDFSGRHPHHRDHHQRGAGPFHAWIQRLKETAAAAAAAATDAEPASASASASASVSHKKDHKRSGGGKRGSGKKWSGKHGKHGSRKPSEKEDRFQAEFVQDLNLVDGAEVASGTFTKKWAVKNAGSMAWAPGTTLVCVDKQPQVTVSLISVPLAEAGQTVEVSVEVTPLASGGRVQSYYRLYNPSAAPGCKRFGPKIWLDVTSLPSAPPTITPPPSLSSSSSPSSPAEEAVVEAGPTPQAASSSSSSSSSSAFGRLPLINLFSLFSAGQVVVTSPLPASALLATPLIAEVASTPVEVVQPLSTPVVQPPSGSEFVAIASSTSSEEDDVSPTPAATVVAEVAPSPAPTPFLELPADEMYPEELRTLFALGFTDLAQCRHLLLAANGDVQKVVNWLLR